MASQEGHLAGLFPESLQGQSNEILIPFFGLYGLAYVGIEAVSGLDIFFGGPTNIKF